VTRNKTRGQMVPTIDIPYDLRKTINNRRSARSFKSDPLKPETMARLLEFSKTLRLPFDCATKIRFFKAEPTKELYRTFKAPIDNVAFLSETDIISIAKTGFVGELVILLAESLGVSTCWYGHYKLPELERLMPHLQNTSQIKEAPRGYGYSKGVTDGLRAICISPLGYYEPNGFRLMDRITKNAYSFKRKEIQDLLENNEDQNSLSDDLIYALDLARKAPSATNSQMWRFGFLNNYRTITVSMPARYRHFKWEHPNVDIGICASHIWLALTERGFAPTIEVHEESGRAVFKIMKD
ncbi:MAG: nitroreductase family protein, partial [Betaproteobacteria bacterium]